MIIMIRVDITILSQLVDYINTDSDSFLIEQLVDLLCMRGMFLTIVVMMM